MTIYVNRAGYVTDLFRARLSSSIISGHACYFYKRTRKHRMQTEKNSTKKVVCNGVRHEERERQGD